MNLKISKFHAGERIIFEDLLNNKGHIIELHKNDKINRFLLYKINELFSLKFNNENMILSSVLLRTDNYFLFYGEDGQISVELTYDEFKILEDSIDVSELLFMTSMRNKC